MLIESIIRRKGGTEISLPNSDGGVSVYSFSPLTPEGPHICEVADMDHASRLLEIKEGFKKAETLKTAISAVDSGLLPKKIGR